MYGRKVNIPKLFNFSFSFNVILSTFKADYLPFIPLKRILYLHIKIIFTQESSRSIAVYYVFHRTNKIQPMWRIFVYLFAITCGRRFSRSLFNATVQPCFFIQVKNFSNLFTSLCKTIIQYRLAFPSYYTVTAKNIRPKPYAVWYSTLYPL